MKKAVAAVILMLALCAMAASGCAQIGFAEVVMDRVNMRQSAGGKTKMQLDEGMSVYVFEETYKKDVLWCRVYTNSGKNCVSGWIRGDMLRFLSEEFTDVVSVEAGYNYVTGVRGDGTVAIMGFDMEHLPCIDTVHGWKNVVQTISQICTVFALDAEGNLLHVGRYGIYEGQKAAKISGESAVMLDADGYLTQFSRDRLRMLYEGLADGIANGRYLEVFEAQARLFLLTAEGKVYHSAGSDGFQELFHDELLTTDIDVFWNHLLALRSDGTVRAWGANGRSESKVDGWTDVVKVAAGDGFSLGLRRDGTVYYAGGDSGFAKRVSGWSGVSDIDAGRGYCIALFADGHVEMAGAYTDYTR